MSDELDKATRACAAQLARYADTRSDADWARWCDAVELVKAHHEAVLERALERAKRVVK